MEQRILVTNQYLENYNQVLVVKEETKDGVTVVDGLGASDFYFYEDFVYIEN